MKYTVHLKIYKHQSFTRTFHCHETAKEFVKELLKVVKHPEMIYVQITCTTGKLAERFLED